MCSATVFFVGLIPDGFQPSGGGRGPKYTENRVCIYYRVKSYMITKHFNRRIKKYFLHFTLYRSTGKNCKPGNRIPSDFFAYFFGRAKK